MGVVTAPESTTAGWSVRHRVTGGKRGDYSEAAVSSFQNLIIDRATPMKKMVNVT